MYKTVKTHAGLIVQRISASAESANRSGVHRGDELPLRRHNRKEIKMSLPTFTMRELLNAGVHFGHHTRRWNPKMAPYLFGSRNDIHIINLEKTVPLLKQALVVVHEVVKNGGRVLFVGTKRQASEIISAEAKRCGQYYVNHRWLGGMLTNWKTVSQSIQRFKQLDDKLTQEKVGFTKKELLQLTRERDNLERSIGGIKEMAGLPDLLFVLDTNKEHIAVKEAKKLGIPVIAVVDSNSNPEDIDYIIPGNDDAIRAIETYCQLVSSSVLEGLQNQLRAAGVDLGESLEVSSDVVAESAEEPTA